MWVEMMRDAWGHLLSFSFDFMISMPDLSNIKFMVPVGVVAVHQFMNFFSDFYAKTRHIGSGEAWLDDRPAEVRACRFDGLSGKVDSRCSYGVHVHVRESHKTGIAEHHPFIVPSSNQPLRTPRQTISKVVFGASSFMNYVLAVNKAKKLASKAKTNFERAMEESAKKEESPPAKNEESAQEEVRIYSLQILFIF